jgi:hypothetical protein
MAPVLLDKSTVNTWSAARDVLIGKIAMNAVTRANKTGGHFLEFFITLTSSLKFSAYFNLV